MKNKLKHLIKFIFDIFLPPRCLICQTIVQGKNGLCGKCFAKVNFLTDQSCPVCGRPYTFPVEGGNLVCGKCLTHPPHFKYSKSVFAYDSFSRQLILPLKHANRTEVVPYLSMLLFQRGRELLEICDYIIPVPLYWRRLLKRKYNQSALLAMQLSKLSKKSCLNGVLIRIKNTQSQGHKTRKERQDNIKGAFDVRHPEYVKGKSIVLIDDVYTTGTTLNECSRVLEKAGAKQVMVLCIARVCRFE